jgi:hypothetical protein
MVLCGKLLSGRCRVNDGTNNGTQMEKGHKNVAIGQGADAGEVRLWEADLWAGRPTRARTF